MAKGANVPFDGKRNADSKPLTDKPFRQLLGKLMHSTQTRPDIQTAVNILATRSNIAEEKDWSALVTILKPFISSLSVPNELFISSLLCRMS
jgi:hypothetical protein